MWLASCPCFCKKRTLTWILEETCFLLFVIPIRTDYVDSNSFTNIPYLKVFISIIIRNKWAVIVNNIIDPIVPSLIEIYICFRIAACQRCYNMSYHKEVVEYCCDANKGEVCNPCTIGIVFNGDEIDDPMNPTYNWNYEHVDVTTGNCNVFVVLLKKLLNKWTTCQIFLAWFYGYCKNIEEASQLDTLHQILIKKCILGLLIHVKILDTGVKIF